MPSGHTDRGTINARRPLTQGMRDLLAEAVRHGHCYPGPGSGASRARALMDRGLLQTPAGKIAIGWLVFEDAMTVASCH